MVVFAVMVIILCDCNWDIPDVDRLPSHSHYRRHRVRRILDGKEMTLIGFVEQDGWEILDVEDGIHIAVAWKDVAKQLAQVLTLKVK